jgi:hypothetical protein
MSDPYFEYYKNEIDDWNKYIKSHNAEVFESEHSEYHLHLIFFGSYKKNGYTFKTKIRFNNVSNKVIPMKSRIYGHSFLEITSSNPKADFALLNAPRFSKRVLYRFRHYFKIDVGSYLLYSKTSNIDIAGSIVQELKELSVKQIIAKNRKIEVKVLRYLDPKKLDQLLCCVEKLQA